MIGQGATHTSSSQGHPSSTRPGGDANITALACAHFDSILSAPLPAASPNPAGDNRRPSAKAPHPSEVLKCPRCDSIDTKFCYYNNYSLTQPRYFCKNCKRYWTAGGALRNVPVGGGLRKNKRSKLKLAAAASDAEVALAAQALAGSGGGQPQNQVEAAGVQATRIVDNCTASGPAPVAMPSHLVVGVPELGAYAHLGTMSSSKPHVGEDLTTSASHYNVNHMVDKNSASMHSVAPTLPQQGGSFIGKDEANAGATCFCDPAQVPQFYSSYASSLPTQYGNAAAPGGAVTGYAVNNYNFFTLDSNANARNEGCGSTSLGAAPPVAGLPSSEVKPEKDAAEGSASSYDWQLIPEGLFTGADVEPDGNFLYAPSSSWPDFSQFNDTGPG
ncbi:hypothetical protein L7F22_046820 [Adiantum nelumboides]|nr:hypothetical protein [Adiantum nelumboides]